MVHKTFEKTHLSFPCSGRIRCTGMGMGSREEPKGSTAMALPRYTVPGTHYKTSQRNFLIEAGLCRGQGAGWDAKERRHLWGSPRGGVSDDKVTHIWDFPASSAPGHRTPRLLRHRGRRLGFPCLPAPLHAIPRGGYPSLASHPRPLGGRGLCGASRCPPGKIGGMLALSSSPRGLSSVTRGGWLTPAMGAPRTTQ